MINQEKTLELVDRSQRKDTTAFAQLVTEFQPMVFRLAFRLLCDEDEARDIIEGVDFGMITPEKLLESACKSLVILENI